MDSILLLSETDGKLRSFLTKVGYHVCSPSPEQPVNSILETKVLDLIVLDHAFELESAELCDFLRATEGTKKIPIVCLARDEEQANRLRDRGFDKVETLLASSSIGAVAAKIATELRLRKMVGKQSAHASLAETNAALRDHNDRLQHELEQARTIQHSLLPKKLPAGEQFELAAYYKPLEEVGGDWYFVNQRSDNSLTLQLADVTGHGLSAAFIGCMTKLALVAADREAPHELLKEMNRLMAPQLPQGTFVTLCSYRFDPLSGHLDFARAGHPPALVVRPMTQQVEKLVGEGFPIGFFEDAEYSEESTTLAPGDFLVTYTDGISEAQNRSGEQFGIDRIGEAAMKGSPTTCKEVIESILQTFDTFCEERILKDDITIVVLKRR